MLVTLILTSHKRSALERCHMYHKYSFWFTVLIARHRWRLNASVRFLYCEHPQLTNFASGEYIRQILYYCWIYKFPITGFATSSQGIPFVEIWCAGFFYACTLVEPTSECWWTQQPGWVAYLADDATRDRGPGCYPDMTRKIPGIPVCRVLGSHEAIWQLFKFSLEPEFARAIVEFPYGLSTSLSTAV